MYARIIEAVTTKQMIVNGVLREVGDLYCLIQTSDKNLDKRFHEVTDYNHLDEKEGYIIVNHLEIIEDRVYKVYEYQEIPEPEVIEDGNICE